MSTDGLEEVSGIRFEPLEGGLLQVTLDRPEVLNAISTEVREGWNRELQRLEREASECRAVIITGTGRAFCAGGDVSQMPDFFGAGPDVAADHLRRFQEMSRLVWRLPVPVVTAINGSALGGGTAVAMMSDLRVASEDSVFAVGQVRRGVVPDVGATYILPRLVGLGRAMELMLSDQRIDAARALEIGLINRVVPADQVLSTAIEMANDLAALSAPTVKWIKRVVHQNQDASFEQALDNEAAAVAILTGTDEFQDGLKAFLG